MRPTYISCIQGLLPGSATTTGIFRLTVQQIMSSVPKTFDFHHLGNLNQYDNLSDLQSSPRVVFKESGLRSRPDARELQECQARGVNLMPEDRVAPVEEAGAMVIFMGLPSSARLLYCCSAAAASSRFTKTTSASPSDRPLQFNLNTIPYNYFCLFYMQEENFILIGIHWYLVKVGIYLHNGCEKKRQSLSPPAVLRVQSVFAATPLLPAQVSLLYKDLQASWKNKAVNCICIRESLASTGLPEIDRSEVWSLAKTQSNCTCGHTGFRRA